jgi:hypothetical protein
MNMYQFVLNDPTALTDPLGTIFNRGKYDNGKHHTLRPDTEDPAYNCLAYGVGSSTRQPPEGASSPDPNLIPPQFGCKKTNCNNPKCESCEHLITIYEDKSDLYNWHVYQQENGQWSCKYGQLAIGDVTDPYKDYLEVYGPHGVLRTCWCCPNEEK